MQNPKGDKVAFVVIERMKKEKFEETEKRNQLTLVEKKQVEKQERKERNKQIEQRREELKKYLTKFRNPKGDI
ncbi:MAG: hypothetical protein P4M11_14955 [Candidatus Pacebacteria bacterium]|nr:hypothetical protein [Candidatus Paceibacterota bacterium]